VTSTHQEKFLHQAQQLQQHLLQELTATADRHSRQMQLLFRWCIALKAVAAVTPTAPPGQPAELIDSLTLSLELLPAIALAASHMQQLRLLSVLGPLDDPDTSSSSSSVQLSAVAAAYMSVVPSAVEAVLCLQDALLHPDITALAQNLRLSFTLYSLKLLSNTPDLLLPLSLSQIIYFGSQLVHSFLQHHQQQQQQQQQCLAAALSQGNTSRSCWSVAEGLLLSRVDVLQSAAATTSHAAALLQHSSRVFEQQWQQLGYPSLSTLTQCNDMLPATLSSSSSEADRLGSMRRALTLYSVVCRWSSCPTPTNNQLRAVASMVLSAASAAVGMAGTESVLLVEAMLLVEACITCFTNSLPTLAKPELLPPAEPAASRQEVSEGPGGSSSSSSSSRAKGAAATQQQQQQQATSTSSCADIAVSNGLLTGQLAHLLQQLVHVTPKAATSFIGKSAAANRESSGSTNSSGKDSSSAGHGHGRSSGSSSNSGGSGGIGGCGSDCDIDGDGCCIHTVIISSLRICVLRLFDMLLVLRDPPTFQQLACVLQGVEAAIRVLVPLLLPLSHTVHPGAKEGIFDPSTMTAYKDLSAVLMHTACTSARLMGLFNKAPGVWEMLTETAPGQQLLQAWLSLQATLSKDYTLSSAQMPEIPYFGPSAAAHQSLMGCLTGQLHAAALAAQKATQQQQQQQQQEQEPAGQAAKQPPSQQQPAQQQQQQQLQVVLVPDPQLVGAVLMQAARYHLHFAEELQAVGEAIEGPATASGGGSQLASGAFARAKLVAEFFTQDASPPKSASKKMAMQLRHDSAECISFARYSASLQGLLQVLINLKDAVAGSPGGLQGGSSQDMLQQLPPGQGAAGAQAAVSSARGDSHKWVYMQLPDQQLEQQWAALFEAWEAPLSDGMPLEQLLQADARLLQATVASAAVHMQEWQQFVEQATGAQGGSAAGGSRHTRKTSKQRKSLALPMPVENVLGAMKALEEALLGRGQLLSILIPSRYCCNNPGCGNIAGPSESFFLVRGRSCVCGGCVSQHDASTGHAMAAR